MKMEELNCRYDGAIPYDERMETFYGGYDAYHRAFLALATRRLGKRCAGLVQALCSWRVAWRYEEKIRETMLLRLNGALNEARGLSVQILSAQALGEASSSVS